MIKKNKTFLLTFLLGLSFSTVALDFFQTKALAEQGNANAQYNLGRIYEGRSANDSVHDIRTDDNQALKWYKKVAEQGHIEAQYDVGYMYEVGQGVLEDYQQAIKWYSKSAKQGNNKAKDKLKTAPIDVGTSVVASDPKSILKPKSNFWIIVLETFA
ncbi:tetratricopeptide repeat protein [Candidatus Thiodubiliella endoseptemdiera]|uniref:tetratricopeptide repeat protein n=1 Tax=Candidatus Thiodubiliella endoseptemdiera TaxID=2738886 RepID=UPI0034DF9C58